MDTMMDVCFNCGIYRADKTVDPNGPYAICPECGYKHPFLQLPLLMVSGASGSGKSTVHHELIGSIKEAVVLDADLLWRTEFNQPENNYRDFMETWLRVCRDISQSGRPVVLFGAGTGVPENIEPCVGRRYFSRIHYLALTCEDEVLTERLKSRPAWRKSSDPIFIEEHSSFNRWFKENHDKVEPAIELLDTTRIPVQETANQVASWIRKKLSGHDTH